MGTKTALTKRCVVVSAAGAVLATVLLSTSARAYSINFAPASQSVPLGQSASVELRVDGVLPGGLGAYDLDIAYDPAILSFASALDAQGLGIAIGLGTTSQPGQLKVSDFSLETLADLLALQSADFALFTLYFDTLAVGTTALSLNNVTLGDAAGNPVSFTASGGRITVTGQHVPEPAGIAWGTLAAALSLARLGRLRLLGDPQPRAD